MKKRVSVVAIILVVSVFTLNVTTSFGYGISEWQQLNKMDSKVTDVRGINAASALFVYLLCFDKQLEDSDGFPYSSWQKCYSDGKWNLWKYKSSADKGDTWIALRAGYLVCGNNNYKEKAYFIKRNVPMVFYESSYC